MTVGKILVVGGYGHVGLQLSRRLAEWYPGRIIIAGRDQRKADKAAETIGNGAKGRTMDLVEGARAETFAGVSLVIVCLDQADTLFAEQCIQRGIHYIDISADYDFLSRVERLDGAARQYGATAVISVGVAPGLTNLLARRAVEKMEQTDRLDILIELGLGDRHGSAAIEWMLDSMDTEYTIVEESLPRSVRSFGNSILMRLPGQTVDRSAYRFSFPDQMVLARTLGVPTISTWFRLDSRIMTWLLARASRAGFGRLLDHKWIKKLAVSLSMNIHVGSDVCGVAVRATGRTIDGRRTLNLGIVGRTEALMTAIVAAETARQVLSGFCPAGVHHSHEAIVLDPIVMELKADLPELGATL